MENEFTKVMSERTDEELIKIVTVERSNYQPLAIEAADLEVEKRNIDTTEFENIREKATNEQEQKDKTNSNVVSSLIRFVNFIIDFFAWFIITFIILTISSLTITIFGLNNGEFLFLIDFIIIFGTFIIYFAFMEIKFQKTLGKFITNTKVVKVNGEKPTSGDIFTRTICRLIPFDQISFLFVKNGIHDFLSKTKVVKNKIKMKNAA